MNYRKSKEEVIIKRYLRGYVHRSRFFFSEDTVPDVFRNYRRKPQKKKTIRTTRFGDNSKPNKL